MSQTTFGKAKSIEMQSEIRIKRSIGTIQLTFIGITSIIGSGWLFSSYYCAQIAGPAAILAWLITAFALLLVALTIAEIGSIFPQSGGVARYLEYTHGSLSGFLSAWFNWLGLIIAVPTEALASTQYLSSLQIFHGLFNHVTGTLSTLGVVVASGLLLVYFLLNYWTLQLFLRSMMVITLFKLIVPLLAALTILWAGFQPANLSHSLQSFMPYGFNSVLIAVSGGGVVFAFNGFQNIVSFAGEAKEPHRTIPIALIASILICLLIYLILQMSFIGTINTHTLVHGWHAINFSSPFLQLAVSFNLNLITLLLYVDAVISPSGTGIAHTGSAARMLFGIQRSGYMPVSFGKIHPVYLIPRNALWASFIVGLIFLQIFRGWGALANVVSVMNSLSYLAGPMAAIGLRRIAPNWHRPCRIPYMNVIALLAFIIVSLIVYWSRWPLTGEVLFVAVAGFLIYLYYQQRNQWKDIKNHLKGGIWFVTYLITMGVLSWLGSVHFGGIDMIKTPYDQVVVIAFSILFYYWGAASAWNTPLLQAFRKNQAML